MQDKEFQCWGRAHVFLGLGKSGHLSWGAMAARAPQRGLWGLMMTVGENSGEGSSRGSSLAPTHNSEQWALCFFCPPFGRMELRGYWQGL